MKTTKNVPIVWNFKTIFILSIDLLLIIIIGVSIFFLGCVKEESLSMTTLFLVIFALSISVIMAKSIGTFKRVITRFAKYFPEPKQKLFD
jgi:flagellar motor component MotA